MRNSIFAATVFLALSLLISINVPYAAIPAPVGYWLFDQQGDVILDSSGNENHGKIIGKINWVKGQFGLAVEFSGQEGNYITIKDSKSLNPKDQLSITCWVKPASIAGNSRIVSKDDETVGRDYLLVQGDGVIEFGTWHPGGSRSLLDTKPALKANEWQHLAGTYDGSRVLVYVNGEEVGQMNAGKGTADSNVPLVFGYYTPNVRPEAYNGILDDVAIFDVALSPSDIKAIINGELYRKISAVDPSGKLAVTWGNIKAR